MLDQHDRDESNRWRGCIDARVATLTESVGRLEAKLEAVLARVGKLETRVALLVAGMSIASAVLSAAGTRLLEAYWPVA